MRKVGGVERRGVSGCGRVVREGGIEVHRRVGEGPWNGWKRGSRG